MVKTVLRNFNNSNQPKRGSIANLYRSDEQKFQKSKSPFNDDKSSTTNVSTDCSTT